MRVRLHSVLRSVALSLLLCAPAALTSCSHGARDNAARGPRLPDALELPDDPERLLYVDAPQRYLDELAELGDSSSLARGMFSSVLGEWVGDEAFAQMITDSVDWNQPLSMVQLGAVETIVSIPLLAEPDEALRASIDALSREGSFGARALTAPNADPAAPRLVWLQEDTLALATSVRGLATAPLLQRRYNSAPIRVAARSLTGAARVQGFEASGSVDAIDVTIAVKSVEELLSSRSAGAGALTSLATSDAVALGGTFAWTGSDAWIQDTVARISDTISEQPFLIRGLVEKIGRRANSVLRTWDGRCFVGISSQEELMFGLGSTDPKKSGVAMLRLFGGVADDLSLLSNFFDGAPSVSLKKNVGDAAGEPIHRITVGNIREQVPNEFRPLLDERGRLRLHFAFSRHTGAGMFVVGGDGLTTLRGWLKQSAAAPGQAAYKEDVIAIRTSVPIFALRNVNREKLLEQFLTLPTMSRARALTVSTSGADAVLIRYRADDTAPARSGPAQAKAPVNRSFAGPGEDAAAF